MGALQLLIWKNLLLRMRHYVLTILELLLPAVFIIVLCFIHNKPSNSFSSFENDLIFPVKNEMDFKAEIASGSCKEWKYSENCILAYVPVNTETTNVMNQLSKVLDLEKNHIYLQGYANEDIITMQVLDSELAHSKNQTVAAIIFENGLSSKSSVSYKIRMNHRSYNQTANHMDLGPFDQQIMTSLFPWEKPRGPNLENAMRYSSTGFTAMQIFLDKILIERLTNTTVKHTYSVQAFPHPRFQKPDINSTIELNKLLSLFLPNTIILGYLFIVPSIVGSVVNERETGIKELMKLCGIQNYMHWLSWIILNMMCSVVSVSIVVLVLFTNIVNSEKDPIITQSDWTVWWFVIFCYATAAAAFCFFVSSFFQKPIIAIICAIIVWLTTFYAPSVQFLDKDRYRRLDLKEKLSVAVLPNMCMSWALKVLCDFEASGEGFKWENFGDPISSVDDMSLYQLFLMFLFDTVLYILLTLYVEEVLPSTYGIPKPWYFLFQADTWCKRKPISSKDEVPNENEGRPEFEAYPEGLQAGVEIKNMKKVFGNYVAVAGVSLKMYSGDIFALLGHNGAGKTTTISCCTGMIPPTSGTAIINGFDIMTQRDAVRKHLGVCPQHDLLFNELTVDEHLKFFGSLKGLSSWDLAQERKEMIAKLQLIEKTNVPARALSGGQKRKLCLGIALIGQAKVVFLDEPTSGMDIEARRAIWDLLLEERSRRTIILTSHFLEEADFLGDRIGIMSHGKLQCCGSPLFLKRIYGTGYTLNLVTFNDSKGAEILSVIQKHIPNASFKDQDRKSNELPINMPIDPTASTMSVFPNMFKDLADKSLEIKSIGLGLTTMDEVFIKVGEAFSRTQSLLVIPNAETAKPVVDVVTTNSTEKRNSDTGSQIGEKRTSIEIESSNPQLPGEITEENSPTQEEGVTESDVTQDTVTEYSVHTVAEQEIVKTPEQPKSEYLSGYHLLYHQLIGLLLKRVFYSKRKWALIIVQFIFPVFLVIVAILSVNQPLVVKTNEPLNRKMNLSGYRSPITLYSAVDNTFGNAFRSAAKGSKILNVKPDLADKLLRIGKDRLGEYRDRYIVAADINAEQIKAMYSTVPYHSSPLAVNLASNTLLKVLGKKQDLKISVTNFPLQNKADYLAEAKKILKLNAEEVWTKSIVFGILTPIGLALLAGSFIVAPLEEKICKGKQLQLMTGLNPVSYWASFFIWDYLIMVIVIGLMVACFPIFQNKEAYTSYGGSWAIFVILLVYGSAAIPFSYLWSLSSDSVIGGFSLVTIFHIFTGILFSFAAYTLEEVGQSALAKIVWFIAMLFPTFGASYSTMRFVAIALENSKCSMLEKDYEKYLCDSSIQIPTELRQCCSGCVKSSKEDCFVPISYLTWSYSRIDNKEDKAFEVPGIAQMLLILFVLGIVFHFMLFLLERKIIRQLQGRMNKTSTSSFRSDPDDDDVAAESQRVDELVKTGNFNQDALVIHKFCKSFGTFAAVSNLSVGVHYGECFGLLGVNGAGKTTTFRMLTGDENRSNGNAFMMTLNFEQDMKKFLANIGYCPQFDAIIGVLTGQENVELYCRLRGVKNVRAEADEWIDRVGLKTSANVQSRKYSGGMKRRLSAAMACVGAPQIIMLDEPTSGVDPISRREFWKVILYLKQSGRAVILTSHSMDEIATCCDRVGIMVNGQFQCLGAVPHLKNKFAQGYTLCIKLKAVLSHDAERHKAFDSEVLEKFSPCTLADKHQTSLVYQIHNASFAWDVLFKTMEDLKAENEDLVEEYSIMESTLEEVFLSFARKQYPERKVKPTKWFSKICRCKCKQ